MLYCTRPKVPRLRAVPAQALKEVFSMKKIYRTEGPDAKLFGVCGGIAEYFGIDPTLVRLATLALIIPGGMSFWIYVAAALIIPTKSSIYPGA